MYPALWLGAAVSLELVAETSTENATFTESKLCEASELLAPKLGTDTSQLEHEVDAVVVLIRVGRVKEHHTSSEPRV